MSEAKPLKKVSYKDSGVDIVAGDGFVEDIGRLLRSTYNLRVIDIGEGFAGLFALNHSPGLFRHNYKDPVLVSCTDGVGTKLKIAFLTGVHRTVGIDLVAMSVNDLIVSGAEPLFFLDYVATGKIDRKVLVWVLEGIAEGCRQGGMAILGGETAEMPGFYRKGEYDLAGFAVGVVERRKILTGQTAEAGDVVIGVASSGLHSNGFSLVRKVLFDVGGYEVEDWIDELDDNLGETLLTPTFIYASMVSALIRTYKVKKVIKSFAHITGGGLPGNIPRVLPADLKAVLEPGSWPVHPIFKFIQKTGNVDEAEMYKVFNMGIGFVVVASPFFASAIIERIEKCGFKAYAIGKIEKGGPGVEIRGIEVENPFKT